MAAPRIRKKTKSEIRKIIIDFLDAASAQVDKKPGRHSCGMVHRNALVLATCSKDMPRATTLEFFNEGMTLYIFGEPGGKLGNIRRNPNVSAAVYEQPMTHRRVQRSLQIFGEADLITTRNNPRLFKSKARKWGMQEVARNLFSPMIREQKLSGKEADAFVQKGLEMLTLIKIVPYHVILREYHPDFSMPKYEWKK